MSGFFDTVGRGAAKGVWAGVKGIGSGMYNASKLTGHILGGGVIGGLYAGLTSGSQSDTGTVRDTMFGAMVGGGLVGAGRLGLAAAKDYLRKNPSAKAAAMRGAREASERKVLQQQVIRDNQILLYESFMRGNYNTFTMDNARNIAMAQKAMRKESLATTKANLSRVVTAGGATLGLGAMTYATFAPESNRAQIIGEYPSTGPTTSYGVSANDPGRIAFQDSTSGLVQGMHRGRHR